MSNNTFTLVRENDFDNLLKAEKGWFKVTVTAPYTQEIVYCCRLPWEKDVVVKVYSSVKKGSGNGRGCGQDAIRVCAVNMKTERGVRKSGRINRVPGWETRLKAKVSAMWLDLKSTKY